MVRHADQSELFRDMHAGSFRTNPSSSSWQTNMRRMFSATPINIDLSMWSVSNVISMDSMFLGASNFEGDGLDSWITTSLTAINGKCVAGSNNNPEAESSQQFTHLPISFLYRYVRGGGIIGLRRSDGMVSTGRLANFLR
jgi:hypothetical protein